MRFWRSLSFTVGVLVACGCANLRDGNYMDGFEELPPKDPGLAAAESFVIPGLGEAYVGNLSSAYWTAARQLIFWPAIVWIGLGLVAQPAGGSKEYPSQPYFPLGLIMVSGGSLGFIAGHTYAVKDAFDAATQYNSHRVMVRSLRQSSTASLQVR